MDNSQKKEIQIISKHEENIFCLITNQRNAN